MLYKKLGWQNVGLFLLLKMEIINVWKRSIFVLGEWEHVLANNWRATQRKYTTYYGNASGSNTKSSLDFTFSFENEIMEWGGPWHTSHIHRDTLSGVGKRERSTNEKKS